MVRVAKDRAVPLELKVPNAVTKRAMRESRLLMKKRNARFSDAKKLSDALDKESRKA